MTGTRSRRLVLAAVLVFLYGPILVLVAWSFNASRLVTVWGGFSTRWYGELLQDRQILEATGLSLRLALAAATAAVVLGTLAAVALTRIGPFRGRSAFGAMIATPLVLPDVLTGLALLLMFVSLGQLLGWPAQRGFVTLWIAHTTFATAYVTVVVSARLAELDRSLEEAAMDLGATPARAFLSITLPIIAPALVAAWLLAFTLSIDDLVISSFVTGPGAATLPIVIFSSVRLGVSPKVNALASLLLLAVVLGSLLAWTVLHRARRRWRTTLTG